MAKYFMLDDYDKAIIFKRKELHNQLGFAIQLCTVRFLGAFLNDPIEIPNEMLKYISDQLKIEKDLILLYNVKKTHQAHRIEIKKFI